MPEETPFRVVLLGPPASGKGTQGRRLASALGLDYLSTGALLREEVGGGTELGKQAAPILERGGYLPDDLMCRILEEWLEGRGGGWVLDGFPRSIPQARFLDDWLARHGSKLDAALFLEVPREELLERILNRVECPACRWSGRKSQLEEGDRCPECGTPSGPRSDDDEENFRNRYDEFLTHTHPVIEYYASKGVLRSCDASAPQDDVATGLLRIFRKNF